MKELNSKPKKDMEGKEKFEAFVQQIEQKMLNKEQEILVLNNTLEMNTIGGSNGRCTNIADSCNGTANRRCTNNNDDNCHGALNRKVCNSSSTIQ